MSVFFRIVIALIGSAALFCSAAAQLPLSPQDESTIQAAIVQLHEDWNHHDMAAYTSHMTDDVQWVNVVGAWWKGKAQVFATLDRFHKTIFKDRQLHPAEQLSIRRIADDVIVSTMINPADAYTNNAGVSQPPTRNVLTLVWVRSSTDGQWRIAQAQNTIETPTGPTVQELVSCKPVSQKTGEMGCWILVSQPVVSTRQSMFWTLDTFPTRDLAEQAKASNAAVVESLGKVWLLTVGDKPKRNRSATRVAQIGPLAVQPGLSYEAQFMEAILQPGMVSKTHVHSGIEAFYTESGETCLETPDGTQIGKKGVDIVVPADVPMELTAIGTEARRGLILILHDASKPPTTLVNSWQSKQLCAALK